MEARMFLSKPSILWLCNLRPHLHHFAHSSSPTFRRASSCFFSSSVGIYRGQKPNKNLVADWVSDNDDVVRGLPIYVGGLSLLAVLFNRAVSGIAPVADASSSQSRADLLTIGLAVTNILTGLVWLSIRPKSITPVSPQGIECKRINSNLPESVVSELMWVWETLSDVTCCVSLVIVYDGICVIQIGFAAESLKEDGEARAVAVEPNKLMKGSLYGGIMKSRAQSYLANLSLYPGKSELPFLPSNTQAVILQPLGDKGIAVLGGDIIRGFTTSDQHASFFVLNTVHDFSFENTLIRRKKKAWVSLVGEKLDSTLANYVNNRQFPTGGSS